jgi:hypothetical protein
MGGTRRLPKLPEGYTLDLANDPDTPALRRPDGVVMARFSAGGMTEEAIEHEAWKDLLHGRASRGQTEASYPTPGLPDVGELERGEGRRISIPSRMLP